MRFLVLLLLLFFSIPILAQKIDNDDFEDSLYKYSYLIFGFYDVKNIDGLVHFNYTRGTCFFIKKDSKTYLVSAKHVFVKMNDDGSIKDGTSPDTLKIRLYDHYNNMRFYNIDIKKIKDTTQGGAYYEDPDIIVFEFKDASHFNINAIEYSVSKINKFDNCNMAHISGYPARNTRLNGDVSAKSFSEQPPIEIKATIKTSPNIDSFYFNGRTKDLINFRIKRADSLVQKGCSGSPVFIKCENSTKWIFSGVFVRSEETQGVSLVTKPHFILNQIEYLSKQDIY